MIREVVGLRRDEIKSVLAYPRVLDDIFFDGLDTKPDLKSVTEASRNGNFFSRLF